MWQWLKDLLTYLEKGFSNYPFLKDVVIASLGVIFGGVVTVIINRGAIRKQALFDMKYDILKEQTKEVNELAQILKDEYGIEPQSCAPVAVAVANNE